MGNKLRLLRNKKLREFARVWWGSGDLGDLFGVELVGDFGWVVVTVESPDFVADLLIGGGDSLAGAEVVEPGLHDEGLVEVLGVVGVTVDAPADGSVAETGAA